MIHPRTLEPRRASAVTIVTVAVAVLLAACSSSAKSSSTTVSAAPTTAAASATPATTAAPATSAALTIDSANIPGLGNVLVNADGRTFYVLTSEKGGKVTCTDDSGCTAVWPDTGIPKGTAQAVAGAGVQASLLGTTKAANGDTYVTYSSYPLYTFAHDAKPGDANGEGIASFGGTWYAISTAGTLAIPGGTASTSAPSSRPGY